MPRSNTPDDGAADRSLAATSTSSGRRDQTGRNRDRGFSFIEVMITITLMSITVVPILGAARTGIKASAVAVSAAEVETALVNAADRINRAPKRCDYEIYARAAVQTLGWDAAQVTAVTRYYEPGSDPTVAGSWVAGPTFGGCSGSEPSPLLVQRVTVTVTSPDGAMRRSIHVVKSDV